MNRITVCFSCGLLLFAGCAVLPPAMDVPASLRTPAEFTKFLNDLTATGEPPGLTFIAARRKGIVYSHAAGLADGPRNTPMHIDAASQWWSVTKPFTAVAVLQLAESGALDLDDPVAKHLPFFGTIVDDKNPRHASVTIRQLLQHSSGLPNTGPEIIGWIHYTEDRAARGGRGLDQLSFVKDKLSNYNELQFTPGSRSAYSNIGYVVLAALIEKKSGLDYETYLRRQILEPLHMDATAFDVGRARLTMTGSHPRDIMRCIVPFYIDTDRAYREDSGGRIWFNTVFSDQQGATGLIGPAPDLARFAVTFLEDDGTLLKPESIRSMLAPGLPTETPDGTPAKMGLAWFQRTDPRGRHYIAHAGAGAAFTAHLRIYPEDDLALIVLANSTYLGRDFGAALLDAGAGIDW